MSGGWKGSGRRQRLPSYWGPLQRRVVTEEPICRCPGCPKCNIPPFQWPRLCTRPSEAADHIVRGDDHRRSNLRGICSPCHGHKSSQEGNAARRRPLGKFGQPPTSHPGSLT